jgi:hypothetical protein
MWAAAMMERGGAESEGSGGGGGVGVQQQGRPARSMERKKKRKEGRGSAEGCLCIIQQQDATRTTNHSSRAKSDRPAAKQADPLLLSSSSPKQASDMVAGPRSVNQKADMHK